jgi:uncharacterized phage-associated protein
LPAEILDPLAEHTVMFTWENTKDISASSLSNWTHKPDSPWSKYYVEGANDIIIPNDDIAEYFSQFVVKQ